jgi:glycosyltransferase involved in cell wall biosynthesis
VNERIKVLWLIKGLGLGGAEMLLARAVPHLDREAFDYEIAYLLPWKDALVGDFQVAGVPVHCLGADARWVPRLTRLLRSRRYDIVHVHSPVIAPVARLLVRTVGHNGSRPRLYYTEHNVWDRYHRVTFWANAITYPLNDQTVAVSDGVRRTIRYPWPVARPPRKPIEVVYQGIDYANVVAHGRSAAWRRQFDIPDDAPVVVSVGNLKHHKGHDQLVRAARLVSREIPETRFVIVGTGQEEHALRDLIARERLQQHVVLTGFRADALDIVADATVFALGSLNEGLAIALLEALALGLPVVATRVGGVPEAVEDGIEGFLVPPRDPKALADNIVRLLRDEALRTKLGEAGRKRARRFDIARAARHRERVYRTLVP